MKKVWNFGNTTLRNPNRIELGLAVVKSHNLEGNLEGTEQEINLMDQLIAEGVASSTTESTDLAWYGRKWRSSMVKLGFLTNKVYRINGERTYAKDVLLKIPHTKPEINYQITQSGQTLLNAKTIAEKQDIYLRQLLKIQLPNPIEATFSDAKMKPFVYILEVLYELQKTGLKGLNKKEVAIFLQTFEEHDRTLIDDSIKNIVEFRKNRESLANKREKLAFDNSALEVAASTTNVQKGTLVDYADTTIRYSVLSGLLTYQGNRINIRTEKLSDVNKLLQEEPNYIDNEIDYLKDFYNGYTLATDDIYFTKQTIKSLSSRLNITMDELPIDAKALKAYQYNLEEEFLKKNELDFALRQMDLDQIKEICDSLSKFERSEKFEDVLDIPAYFEWIIWRSFLAIDSIKNPISETRGFPIDSDLIPIHPASSGKPDMNFEFADFGLVVEVTLTTSERQYIAEAEPVRRHVAQFQLGTSVAKDIYGLFIAPKIENNLLESMRGAYYRGDDAVYLNILPINTKQFRMIFESLKKKRFLPEDLRQLIDSTFKHRNLPAPLWKVKIDEEVLLWLSKR